MSALDRILGRFGLARRAILGQPSDWMWEAFGGIKAGSGVNVTPQSALRFSAVWACVRVISETIATLPVHVYERSDAGRDRRDDLPEARVLFRPSRIMTSVVLRESLTAHVLLWGNCYAAILRNGAGDPVELIPVEPPYVRVRRQPNGELAYDIRMTDRMVTLNQADVIHVPGLGFDGIQGLSPVRFAAQSIGLAIAAEEYGGTFFGNASTPSGFISVPGALTQDQAKVLREQWQSVYGGTQNAHRTAVIPQGGKFEKITIPNNEAQFIESRKFQVTEIARWFRVPPHMIADLDRATFSNIEHQSLEFVQHTLRPWLVRWEQELNRKLFPDDQDTGQPSPYYVEFNVDGLLRGDVKARADYYVKGRQWGWLSANDVRRMENMPPIQDGDLYVSPLNMQTASQAAAGSDPSPDGNI